MKPIQITPAELRSQAAEMAALRAEYENLFSNLDTVLSRTNDAWSENLSHNFVGKISSTKKSCSGILEALQWGVNAATKSADSFESVDIAMATGLNGGENGETTESPSKSTSSTGWGKKALELLSKVGFSGSLLAANLKLFGSIGDLAKDTNAKNVASLLKNGNSLVKGVSEFFKDAKKLEKYSRMNPGGAVKTGMKRFVGLNTYMKNASTATSFSTKVYNNFNKLKEGGPFKNYTKGGATSAFAWIGTGLSLAANGITNYEDYKAGKIDKAHAIANTAVSTGVDVVKNWAIGVGVAAVAVAVIPGATALTVGVATVAAGWALDGVTKWATKTITKKVTGKDTEGIGSTELITKAIVGIGECAWKAKQKEVKGLQDFFKYQKRRIIPAI